MSFRILQFCLLIFVCMHVCVLSSMQFFQLIALNLLFFMDVPLIYNVSSIQQSDSVVHTHTYKSQVTLSHA